MWSQIRRAHRQHTIQRLRSPHLGLTRSPLPSRTSSTSVTRGCSVNTADLDSRVLPEKATSVAPSPLMLEVPVPPTATRPVSASTLSVTLADDSWMDSSPSPPTPRAPKAAMRLLLITLRSANWRLARPVAPTAAAPNTPSRLSVTAAGGGEGENGCCE